MEPSAMWSYKTRHQLAEKNFDNRHTVCCAEHSSQLTHTSSTNLSNLRFQNRIDVDCETESNHDTALTLACAGGHFELATILLLNGADPNHLLKVIVFLKRKIYFI